jgi:hypothetical protein
VDRPPAPIAAGRCAASLHAPEARAELRLQLRSLSSTLAGRIARLRGRAAAPGARPRRRRRGPSRGHAEQRRGRHGAGLGCLGNPVGRRRLRGALAPPGCAAGPAARVRAASGQLRVAVLGRRDPGSRPDVRQPRERRRHLVVGHLPSPATQRGPEQRPPRGRCGGGPAPRLRGAGDPARCVPGLCRRDGAVRRRRAGRRRLPPHAGTLRRLRGGPAPRARRDRDRSRDATARLRDRVAPGAGDPLGGECGRRSVRGRGRRPGPRPARPPPGRSADGGVARFRPLPVGRRIRGGYRTGQLHLRLDRGAGRRPAHLGLPRLGRLHPQRRGAAGAGSSATPTPPAACRRSAW